jgi:hypothetical protein
MQFFCDNCHSPIEVIPHSGDQFKPAGGYVPVCRLCVRKEAYDILEAHLSRPLPPLPGAQDQRTGDGRILPPVLGSVGPGDTAATAEGGVV